MISAQVELGVEQGSPFWQHCEMVGVGKTEMVGALRWYSKK